MTRELTEAILAEVPEAEIEAVEGDEGVLTVQIFFCHSSDSEKYS